MYTPPVECQFVARLKSKALVGAVLPSNVLDALMTYDPNPYEALAAEKTVVVDVRTAGGYPRVALKVAGVPELATNCTWLINLSGSNGQANTKVPLVIEFDVMLWMAAWLIWKTAAAVLSPQVIVVCRVLVAEFKVHEYIHVVIKLRPLTP